jgi:hypothetical protein
MKHVIVIETCDPPEGGPISNGLQSVLLRAVEIGVQEGHGVCFVQGKFNVVSAITAVHEMYNAPEWRGGI